MSADVVQFACPCCRARLRLRELRQIDRQVPCPECRATLRIETAGSPGEVTVTMVAAAEPLKRAESAPAVLKAAAAGQQPVPAARSDSTKRTDRPIAKPVSQPDGSLEPEKPARPQVSRDSRPARVNSPHRALVIMTAMAAVMLVAFAARTWFAPAEPRAIESSVAVEPVVHGVQANPEDMQPQAAGAIPDGPVSPELKDGVGVAVELPETVEDRLDTLGDRIADFVAETGRFPQGAFGEGDLPESQRFSWLAILADRQSRGNGPRAFWGHAWNAVDNDPFVRRRLVEYQNPLVRELTGGDGYPATHFVGLAGVGPAALRRDADPRLIGLFPPGRAIAPAEVRDGLAHTILACGVTAHLGSWAAAGHSTVRVFSQGPVVDGPDGLGTGQPEGMLVLLADGRVQHIAREIDPAVFRRLVAIADDVSETEAEPSVDDPVVATDGVPAPAAAPLDDSDEALDDDAADRDAAAGDVAKRRPAANPVDIEAGLAQPILRFDQPSRRLVEALAGIAELAGAPIRYDAVELGAAAAGLETRVTLALKQTTVRAILEGLLSQGGLTFRVEKDHIRVVAKE